MKTPKRYIVKTLGCKANFYDSQLIELELQKRGWLPWFETHEGLTEKVDLCVVNSCTVTDEADRQTRKLASRLFRENPEARVVVTGCGAEVEPERLAASKGVHYVIGNRQKPELVEMILKVLEDPARNSAEAPAGTMLGKTSGFTQMLSRHPMEREWPLVESVFLKPPVHLEGHSGKTRAFLKIQEGCNSFCTYCIIPYGRGPSRSLGLPELLGQIRSLVSEGIREVVLTGTNLGDYGSDWGAEPALPRLLRSIFEETELERLRVSSLDPTEISPEIFDLMAREKRFCPHFHISLQSPDSRILRLMKRKYGFEQVKVCLQRASSLPAPAGGVFIGMDVITGFPGESDDDFERTYEVLTSLPWSRLHVFPYSERTGTPATRLLGGVPKEVRQNRADRLKALSSERLLQIHQRTLVHCQKTGEPLEAVLLEKPVKMDGKVRVNGYTSNYLRIFLEPRPETKPETKPSAEQQSPGRNEILEQVEPVGIREDRAGGDVAFIARLKANTL